ncbi:Crp/Fnr family transcriptional regulator [Persicitalea jodogahamensis]|uniref:Cyclic nucleotide-binding domain-containing protein n=1 Tax=Persicitalea jodogahamensis TaxID=402147 RepID=A0A8J3GAI0_9BACT|nr:hypothetical protein [Persicitalea jodogahamensis]GHB83255.1 hypothetical protein GCM10007390_42790 [Persicitalea jodogahamensis]
MEMLLSLLTKLTRLPKKDLIPALDLFESIQIPAKTTLLVPGAICTKIWFVGSGSLRGYYLQEEQKRTKGGQYRDKVTREVTDWLIPSDSLFTPMPSFTKRIPTAYYVETMQASQLFTLSYQSYLALKKLQPEAVFKIYEHAMNLHHLRIKLGNMRHPEDRLRMFELTHRGMMANFPCKFRPPTSTLIGIA